MKFDTVSSSKESVSYTQARFDKARSRIQSDGIGRQPRASPSTGADDPGVTEHDRVFGSLMLGQN
jgi:hypothetical protein